MLPFSCIFLNFFLQCLIFFQLSTLSFKFHPSGMPLDSFLHLIFYYWLVSSSPKPWPSLISLCLCHPILKWKPSHFHVQGVSYWLCWWVLKYISPGQTIFLNPGPYNVTVCLIFLCRCFTSISEINRLEIELIYYIHCDVLKWDSLYTLPFFLSHPILI